MILNGRISVSEYSLRGILSESVNICGVIHKEFSLNGSIVMPNDYPDYTGSYEVTPKVFQQELNTDDRSLTSNILIKAIPYAEVSNKFGGMTVTIGG